MSDLSDTQKAVIAIVPKVSASLSAIGSIWILVEVIGDPKKRGNMYHRLLAAMSIYDILESFWNFMSNWAIPRDVEEAWNPKGNQGTCTAQGFFLQLGLAIPVLNAMLSIYYLMIVRYRMREAQMKRWIEPSMHIVAFVVGFGTAISAVPLTLYNPSAYGLWSCWINSYPFGCHESWRGLPVPEGATSCTRGDNAWLYRFAFYFVWVWVAILVAAVATVVLYFTVRNQEKRSSKYASPERYIVSRLSRTSSTDSADVPDPATSSASWSTGIRKNASKLMNTLKQEKERKKLTRSQQVMTQAIWYIGAFILTHFTSLLNQFVFFATGNTFYALYVSHLIFDPGQGVFNFVVYRRPRYLHFRKNENLSRFQCLYLALRWSFLPPIDLADKVGKATSSAEVSDEYDSFHAGDDVDGVDDDEDDMEKHTDKCPIDSTGRLGASEDVESPSGVVA